MMNATLENECAKRAHKCKAMNKSKCLPSDSSRFHVIRQSHVVRPDIKLPLTQSKNSAQNWSTVDSDSHIQIEACLLSNSPAWTKKYRNTRIEVYNFDCDLKQQEFGIPKNYRRENGQHEISVAKLSTLSSQWLHIVYYEIYMCLLSCEQKIRWVILSCVERWFREYFLENVCKTMDVGNFIFLRFL